MSLSRLLVLTLALAACTPKPSDDGDDTDVTDTVVVDTIVVDTDLDTDGDTDVTPTCDDPESSSDPCNDCLNCANAGPCDDEATTCGANDECVAIKACADACSTEDCVQACIDAHPDGEADLTTWVACLYDTCPVTCPQ